MKSLTLEMWLPWLGATLMAAVTLCGFVFTNFETSNHAKERADELVQRLDRLEEKIDHILEQTK